MRRMPRRFFLLVMLPIAAIVLAVLPASADYGSYQPISTNTPRPAEPAFATNTPPVTAVPTLAPITPLVLQTNTPGRPSLTPSPSFTPSNTPTATPTATNTATATSTPTATFTPSNTPTATDTPSPTPTPNGPFVYPEGVNPLTGLPYPNEEALARRNLIVKISNFPPIVRPQHGVNAADVVWEYEAEGGVTRFAAIYRNNAPTHVGSVRSARLFDLELVVMYNALLAYSGTSEPIQQLILGSDWVFRAFSPLKGDNCENAGFCRFPEDGLPLEHTMFLDTTTLYDLATERGLNTGYRARGFAFSPDPDPGGVEANDVFIDWYGQTDARWQFDAETGRYLRYTDSVPHYDAADGEQLWADNIVILEVPHDDNPDIFPEGASYLSLEVQLWDQGRAYVVRDGRLYEGFWRRACDARSDPAGTATPTPVSPERTCFSDEGTAVQLIYGNNQSIMLKPGRTWVEVVRWLGDVRADSVRADMSATATAIAGTPTVTPDPATINEDQ